MEDSGAKVIELARPLREFLLAFYGDNAHIVIDTEKVTIVEDDFGGYFEE